MPDYEVTVDCLEGAITAANGRVAVPIALDVSSGTWLPTELFLAGLGSCMLGNLLAYGQKFGIEVGAPRAVLKATSLRAPSRMGAIQAEFVVPRTVADNEIETLLRAAGRCKVHNTLQSGPEVALSAAKGYWP